MVDVLDVGEFWEGQWEGYVCSVGYSVFDCFFLKGHGILYHFERRAREVGEAFGITGPEIIEDDDMVTLFQECFYEMHSEKPCALVKILSEGRASKIWMRTIVPTPVTRIRIVFAEQFAAGRLMIS